LLMADPGQIVISQARTGLPVSNQSNHPARLANSAISPRHRLPTRFDGAPAVLPPVPRSHDSGDATSSRVCFANPV
jgi:hypothetical protein